jgi:hypothetical protein
MKGERITARSIHATTQSSAIDERERTLLAKIMMAAGSIMLIILKVFALFILIGLVVGCSVLGFIGLVTTPALLSTDFITGLAIGGLFSVMLIPMIVLIYLTVMLLVARRPNTKVMMALFIVWLLSLVVMVISAIKSPVHFDRQIENTFESVFDNNSKILYDEFSEQEIDEFREKISNMDISTKQQGDITLTLQGSSDEIEKVESQLTINEDGVTITADDEKIEITANGITINGKKFIDYTTETVESADSTSKAIIFSLDNVKIKFEESSAK